MRDWQGAPSRRNAVLKVKDAGIALLDLREAGLVEGGTRLVRPTSNRSPSRCPPTGSCQILEHVASKAFVPQTYYEEKEINERLRAWCDGGELDHVTIRRYLADFGLLERGGGMYEARYHPLPM